jgi:hypothetical protein
MHFVSIQAYSVNILRGFVNKKPDTVQTAVRLPRRMLYALRQSARGVSEEIRARLRRSLDEDNDPETRKLVAAINRLAGWVKLETGHAWHSHPAATRIFLDAITARLARLKPDGEPEFGPGELPARRVFVAASNDLTTIGLALEAIEFHTPPVTDEDRRRVEEELERVVQDINRSQDEGDKS